MREVYHEILKRFFAKAIYDLRKENLLTQSEMAKLLIMDERSYIDLENEKSCCGAITLVIFLIYICKDSSRFLRELRNIIDLEILSLHGAI